MPKKRGLGTVRYVVSHYRGSGISPGDMMHQRTRSGSVGSEGSSRSNSVVSITSQNGATDDERVDSAEEEVCFGEIQADGIRIKSLQTGRIFYSLDAWIKVVTLERVWR